MTYTENENFMLLMHILSRKCSKIDFKGLFDNLRPFLFVLMNKLVTKQ